MASCLAGHGEERKGLGGGWLGGGKDSLVKLAGRVS